MRISRRSFLALPFARVFDRAVADDTAFLRQMVLDVLDASRVAPGSSGPPGWAIKNSCGFPLVTPGKGGYPAFWVRDFSMATDSGLVPEREIRDHLLLVARCQNGAVARTLGSGATVPPHAIPDHINFDGAPVFFPGTYSSGEDQGSGPWGKLPPMDDHYEFVHIAFNLVAQSGPDVLLEQVGGLKLVDRLERAFDVPMCDPKTGLATTTLERRAVGFGFCDAIVLTGSLLMPSLLRWRAAGELAHLTGQARYKEVQATIAKKIVPAFLEERTGWLLAATEIGRQPDVWGTLFALQLGVLEESVKGRALEAVVTAYERRTIALSGAIRHVPTDRDFSEQSAWESTYVAKGTYQNGAFWHTATGWLLDALLQVSPNAYASARRQFFTHLRLFDYRLQEEGCGAPWECFGPDLSYSQNPAYLASISLPYASLVRR